MSPIPCPTPLRRTLLRMMFSPAGLLCGFVVLIIATCPGARGESGFSLLAANDFLPASSGADISSLPVPATPTAPAARVIGRSTRFDRGSAASTRLSGAAEQAARAAAQSEAETFRHSRVALPLLADPVITDADTASRISPMTGPAVGIRHRVPGTAR